MKKVVLSITALLLTLTLMGCPPITTQPLLAESTPIVELLFDLPEGASIVSESFDFSLLDSQYISIPNMHVNGTYVIQNDGVDATMNILYPTIMESSFYDIRFINSSLRVKVNHIQEDLQWSFSNLAEEQITLLDITYDYFNQYTVKHIEDPTSITVHKYKFDCPKSGTGEELTLIVPEGTFILYEWYMENTYTEDVLMSSNVQNRFFQYSGPETSIPSFSKDTTLTIYTIDYPADFSANYDFNGIHEIDNLANIVVEKNGSIFQARYLVNAIEKNQELNIDSLFIEEFLINTEYGVTLLSMFTLFVPLPGNGAQTTIEVSFPSLEYGTLVEGDIRYLFYDFYLDTARYEDLSIPVTLSIQTDYDIVSNTYDIADASIIHDFSLGTRLHMEFSTVYEKTPAN